MDASGWSPVIVNMAVVTGGAATTVPKTSALEAVNARRQESKDFVIDQLSSLGSTYARHR